MVLVGHLMSGFKARQCSMIPTREELCQTLSHAGQLWTRPSQLQTHARATGGMPMFRQFFLGLRSAQTRF